MISPKPNATPQTILRHYERLLWRSMIFFGLLGVIVLYGAVKPIFSTPEEKIISTNVIFFVILGIYLLAAWAWYDWLHKRLKQATENWKKALDKEENNVQTTDNQ